MKHPTIQPSLQKKMRIVRDEKRTIQVAIPPAYKDGKLALATGTDGATTKNQCTRPQNELGRTFHCSVCNKTLKSKPDHENHIMQTHKKRSSRKDSRHNTLSATHSSINYGPVTKNKTMNPAKIVDHSGLIHAENRLRKARYKHQSHSSSSSNGTRHSSNIKPETIELLTSSSQAIDNAVVDTSCQLATASSARTYGTASNNHRSSSKDTLDPDTLPLCSVRSRYTAPHQKRRKLTTASDMMVDIEVEEQKMKRALCESSQQGLQVEVQINPIIVSNATSCLHPVVNDPNHYCRVCHVSHSTQEAYQIHLQTKHHVAFPSLSTQKKAQKLPPPPPPAVTRPDNKLCKYYTPIQITFDHPKSSRSTTTTREQMKDANVQPDLDDPNHYCQSCHITKPNRTSYLAHLCMIHQITSRKKKRQQQSPKC